MFETFNDIKDWLTPKRMIGLVALSAVLGGMGFAAHDDVKQQRARDEAYKASIQDVHPSPQVPEDD